MRRHIARALAVPALVLALVLTAPAPGAASEAEIRTFVNGRPLETDVNPLLVGGRTLVPARAIFAALGAAMEWDPATSAVTAVLGSSRIELQPGSRAAWVSGRLVLLDVPARVVQGRTMVPLRFVGEALGALVAWNAAERAVLVDARAQVSRGGDRSPGDEETGPPAEEPGAVPAGAPTALRTLIAAALSVEGAPYRWGATGPTRFDCSGFTSYVFAQAGLELPRTSFEQYRAGTPIDRSELRTGDMVFFTTYAKGASHAGIYLTDGLFISASSSRGVAVDSLSEAYWARRYIGARRFELPDPAATAAAAAENAAP